MQLLLSALLKGIIRKECLSFTNHGHAKTPPTVFHPLLLWLTLPRDMGVRHTQWPPSIARAILACLWFCTRLKKIKAAESFLRACGLHNIMFRVILCIQFYRLTQLILSTLLRHPVICNDNDKRRYAGGKTFLGAGFIFNDYLVSVKK